MVGGGGAVSSLAPWLNRSLTGTSLTCLLPGWEDTVNQAILPEKAALTVGSSEDNTKVFVFLVFDIFFKDIFIIF